MPSPVQKFKRVVRILTGVWPLGNRNGAASVNVRSFQEALRHAGIHQHRIEGLLRLERFTSMFARFSGWTQSVSKRHARLAFSILVGAGTTIVALFLSASELSATGTYDFSDAWRAPQNNSAYPLVRHTDPGNTILRIVREENQAITDFELEATALLWGNLSATGDDLSSSDDETADWWAYPVPDVLSKHLIVACGEIQEKLHVVIQGTGYFNAWIDFHGDGFTNADRIGSANAQVSNQTITTSFNVPCNAWINWDPFSIDPVTGKYGTRTANPTHSRFRLSASPLPDPGYSDPNTTVQYPTGEVEDHIVDIVLARPDLKVSLTTEVPARGAYLDRGDTIRYQVNVENQGHTTAHDVVVTTTLPPSIAFTGLNRAVWADGTAVNLSCSEADNVVTCTLTDNLAPTKVALIYLDTQVTPGSACWINGSAEASTSDVEYTLTNNADSLIEPINTNSIHDAWDGGDAPDSFITKLRNLPVPVEDGTPTPAPVHTGPRHWKKSNLKLGQEIDQEVVFAASDDADGDDASHIPDDEDGIDQTAGTIFLVPGATNTLSVSANTAGRLSAWVDMYTNGSGQYGTFDTADRIAHNQLLSAGSNTISFTVPGTRNNVVTYARLRFVDVDETVDDPDDIVCELVRSGEVEDYKMLLSDGSAPPDIEVEKNDIYDPVGLDEDFAYFLKATNRGFGPANGVILRDNLPPEIEVIGQPTLTASGMAPVPQGWSCNYLPVSHRVECSFGLIPPGVTAKVEVNSRVKSDAFASPTTSKVIYNTAAATVTPESPDTFPNSDVEETNLIVPCKVDLIFVVDISNSIVAAGISWQQVQDAASSLLNALDVQSSNPDNQAALIRFGLTAVTEQTLTNDRTLLDPAISALPGSQPPDPNGTDMVLALDEAEQELLARGRPDAIPVIVLISDGEQPENSHSPSDVLTKAESIRNGGARIHGIKVGSQGGSSELMEKLSTRGYFRTVDNGAHPIIQELVELGYEYCVPPPTPGGATGTPTPTATVTATPTATATAVSCISQVVKCPGGCDRALHCMRLTAERPIPHPQGCSPAAGYDLDVWIRLCGGIGAGDIDVRYDCKNGQVFRMEHIGFDQGSGEYHLWENCTCANSEIDHIRVEGKAPSQQPVERFRYEITCCNGACP